MANQSRPIAPVEVEAVDQQLMKQVKKPHVPDTLPGPTPQEIDAADAVFAQKQKDSDMVDDLMSLWAGGLLLHNLAVDNLRKSPEQTEEELRAAEKEKNGERGA